jgi:hypothetical protein
LRCGSGAESQTNADPAGKAAVPCRRRRAFDIQADIQKPAASSKLKAEPFRSVSGGVATFTGTAKNEGNKNSVAGLAKSAGAKSTVNNITVAAPPAKKK